MAISVKVYIRMYASLYKVYFVRTLISFWGLCWPFEGFDDLFEDYEDLYVDFEDFLRKLPFW